MLPCSFFSFATAFAAGFFATRGAVWGLARNCCTVMPGTSCSQPSGQRAKIMSSSLEPSRTKRSDVRSAYFVLLSVEGTRQAVQCSEL
eukprot:11183477-Lingulodinium_polyedra.AAC.1